MHLQPCGGPWGRRKRFRRSVAQLARAPVSKTGGWGFESLHSCHPSGGRLRTLRALRTHPSIEKVPCHRLAAEAFGGQNPIGELGGGGGSQACWTTLGRC